MHGTTNEALEENLQSISDRLKKIIRELDSIWNPSLINYSGLGESDECDCPIHR